MCDISSEFHLRASMGYSRVFAVKRDSGVPGLVLGSSSWKDGRC